MPDVVRWGILGTGNIASRFVEALGTLPDAEVVAVGSRAPDSATQFGNLHDVPRRHGSYADLVNDCEVDAVYVATPHPLHRENALAALNAGKAVLCEKPFTMTASEAGEVVATARERGVFLMEAMWTRFLPAVQRLRKLLSEGVIGEPRGMIGRLGMVPGPRNAPYLLDPELGGGVLLDSGVYPVSLATYLFGAPQQVRSVGLQGKTGVDTQVSASIAFGNDVLVTLSMSFEAWVPPDAIVYGTGGSIHVRAPIFRPTELAVSTLPRAAELAPGGGRFPWDMAEVHTISEPVQGSGWQYPAAEVGECLRSGRLESTAMPLSDTLLVMKTLDEIRSQWGWSAR